MIEFSSYVAPACLPKKSNRVTSTFRGNHCEIAGWGMQVSVSHSLKMWLHCLLLYFVYKEYNNTSSYPTSIRAAKIKVSITSPSNSNIAIQYRHRPVCQTTIIHFRCYLFCLKGWNSAEQQVQLALWTRRCKDWKILRGGKS